MVVLMHAIQIFSINLLKLKPCFKMKCHLDFPYIFCFECKNKNIIWLYTILLLVLSHFSMIVLMGCCCFWPKISILFIKSLIIIIATYETKSTRNFLLLLLSILIKSFKLNIPQNLQQGNCFLPSEKLYSPAKFSQVWRRSWHWTF